MLPLAFENISQICISCARCPHTLPRLARWRPSHRWETLSWKKWCVWLQIDGQHRLGTCSLSVVKLLESIWCCDLNKCGCVFEMMASMICVFANETKRFCFIFLHNCLNQGLLEVDTKSAEKSTKAQFLGPVGQQCRVPLLRLWDVPVHQFWET